MFYDIFLQLCAEKGVKPTRVALDLGYSKNAATKWKAGSIPSGAALQKLADYFGVSVDYLLGNEETSPAAVTEDDETIIVRQRLKERPCRNWLQIVMVMSLYQRSSSYLNFGTSVVTLLRKNKYASGDPECTSNHLSEVK